jgi:hypothetical protein
MAIPLPESPRWRLYGVCAGCQRGVALTIGLAGGRLPDTGAVQLEALCGACGHVWDLPAAATGSRAARETPPRPEDPALRPAKPRKPEP